LVLRTLRAEIEKTGPVPFERFMELALYGPEGYFTAGPLRSEKAGDFLTSPEVSPFFGATLAALVREEYLRIGPPFHLVEVAAGSGSLLRPLLAAYPVEAWAVEVSPAARGALSTVVPPERVVADLSSVPDPLRGVVITNELVDNLPMALAQFGEQGWRERWVGMEGNGFGFLDHAVRPEVADWLAAFAGPVEAGDWVEVQLAAGRWLAATLERMVEGSLLVIDFGDLAENLAPRRRQGTLRTYRSHHLGPHPLDQPGAIDITADVNFSALCEVAVEAGAEVELTRQEEFLSRLGLRDQLRELRVAELEMARSARHQDRLQLRSQVTEVETLLHPRGLGDFRVLIARKLGTDSAWKR
jgi:SAM-dependent MidA family methyltransferase